MNTLIGAASSTASLVKETSTRDFPVDVLDASVDVPVIVDFWAPWCGPCKTLGPLLEKAVKATNGAVRMVKLNVDDHPEYPAQMRVQSIPAVFAFKDGRPVDGFTGALPESQIKAFVQRVMQLGGPAAAGPSPIEEALDMAKQSAAQGDHARAEAIYQQILQHEPANLPALVGLARAALAAQDLDEAKSIASRIPAEQAKHADVVSLYAAIELAEHAAKNAGAVRQFEKRLESDPNDHEARLEYANLLFAGGEREPAIDHLLAIVKADRDWNEQAGRKQLLKLLEAMGPADPLTVRARKRLSSILFS